jgi:hypothetical protein
MGKGTNMNWKFWQKNAKQGLDYAPKAKKLPRPKDLPFSVGRHLVTELNCNPDWVWTLKSVSRPVEGVKGQYEVLVFNEEAAIAKGIAIHNYNDLNANSELILFEGRYEKDNPNVEVTVRRKELIKTAAA